MDASHTFLNVGGFKARRIIKVMVALELALANFLVTPTVSKQVYRTDAEFMWDNVMCDAQNYFMWGNVISDAQNYFMWGNVIGDAQNYFMAAAMHRLCNVLLNTEHGQNISERRLGGVGHESRHHSY